MIMFGRSKCRECQFPSGWHSERCSHHHGPKRTTPPLITRIAPRSDASAGHDVGSVQMLSNRLTRAELDAVIAVAGDADMPATIESCYPEDEREAVMEAYESGIEKLRRQLANKEGIPS